MAYKTELTDEFIEEIRDIFAYISNTLKDPNAARRLRKKVIHNILLLEDSPRICKKTEKLSKAKRPYRRMVINNYIILYTIDETNKVVYISHIYYNKRNYIDYLL